MTTRVEAVYTTPVSVSLRPAYCVARIGNRPRSICAVPLIRVPSPMYERITSDDAGAPTPFPASLVPGSANPSSSRSPADSLVALLSWTYRPTMKTGRMDSTKATTKTSE